jgi:hypothetical protein
MIDNIDKNTIKGIMFVSIHLDAVTNVDDVITGVANTPVVPSLDEDIWVAGSEQTIETNFGYIRFDSDVTILNQTTNEVTIIVPYDVNSLTITTKDSIGELITEVIEVA